MPTCHNKIADCEHPSIKNLFLGSKYCEKATSLYCHCVKKTSIYSREWDYEQLEHFQHFTAGINFASNTITEMLSLNPTMPKQVLDITDTIPQQYRQKMIDVISIIGDAKIEESIERFSIYINSKKDDFSTGFIGYVDITPLGDICDAFIKPPLWMIPPRYYLTCEKKYYPETTLRFKESEIDEIKCTPYVNIGGIRAEIGVCAQYAVRMALMIMSLSKAPSVPELNFEANQTTLSGGIEREQSAGWNGQEIQKIIERNKYGAFLYARYKCPKCQKIVLNLICEHCRTPINDRPNSQPSIENIYAYVESGIPVILGVQNTKWLSWWEDGDVPHALVAIGHTMTEDGGIDGLIVHDESRYPYQVLKEPLKEGKRLEDIIINAVVPIPREVIVDYELAKQMAISVMVENKIKPNDIFRPFLTDPHHAKKLLGEKIQRIHLEEFNYPDLVKKDFLESYMDRFVWLFEISRIKNEKRHYLGDVVISATKPELLAYNFLESKLYMFKNKKREISVKSY